MVVSWVSSSRLWLCLEHDSPLLTFKFLGPHLEPHLGVVITLSLAHAKPEPVVQAFKLLICLGTCLHQLVEPVLLRLFWDVFSVFVEILRRSFLSSVHSQS